jgi:peptidoglycan/LPS O-acetylase OafA/YrhL
MVPINYRPEIDSLRALSVFFIIIYHAKISLFNYTLLPGGFLGVDIFFLFLAT